MGQQGAGAILLGGVEMDEAVPSAKEKLEVVECVVWHQP